MTCKYKEMTKSVEERKVYQAEWYNKNKEKRREQYNKNRDKIKLYSAKRYVIAKEEISKYDYKRREDIKNHAVKSLENKEIIDCKKWKLYCNRLRASAETNNKPYSSDFTDDMIFKKMIDGCYYCQDLATTIDRINSNLYHHPTNCVGSCFGCNNSKGNSDHDTFIRKSYYRARGKYYDDDVDIWSDNLNRPNYGNYKKTSNDRGIVFDISKDYFNTMTKEDCRYCKRSLPIGKYNGVDRIIPKNGYTLDNTVPCCDDCNTSKLTDSVDQMLSRDGRIADRIENGDLILINCDKVLRNKGVHSSTKKVCVYGNVYESQIDASRNTGIDVRDCIRFVKQPDSIFNITSDFYKFMIENKFENITKKMYLLFNRM